MAWLPGINIQGLILMKEVYLSKEYGLSCMICWPNCPTKIFVRADGRVLLHLLIFQPWGWSVWESGLRYIRMSLQLMPRKCLRTWTLSLTPSAAWSTQRLLCEWSVYKTSLPSSAPMTANHPCPPSSTSFSHFPFSFSLIACGIQSLTVRDMWSPVHSGGYGVGAGSKWTVRVLPKYCWHRNPIGYFYSLGS